MRLLMLMFVALMLAACNGTPPDDEVEPKPEEDNVTESEETDNTDKDIADNDETAETEKPENSEPPYDDKGNVDILSPAFYEDYLNNYHLHSYGGVERGMTRDEVIAVLGEPSGEESTHGVDVFNDLSVTYAIEADSVEQVLITPQDNISLDDVIAAFGEPTQDLSPEEAGSIGRVLTYQSSADSNYYISISSDEDDFVILIHPANTHNSEVVNRDNVMGFIESYYDRNLLDMSLVSFEEPYLNTEMGYFEVPFVNNHNGLTGHFRVSFFGLVEYINENGEYVYGEFIPYAGGEFK